MNPNSDMSHNGTGMRWQPILILSTVLIGLFILDLLLGSVRIPIMEVFNTLLGNANSNEAWSAIILKIRLPRAITAILAGAALSIGGLQMQTLFRNPLAGPSILGITAGSSLGVAAVMLVAGSATTAFTIRQLGLGGSWLIIIAATIGAALVLLLILGISFKIRDNVVMLIVDIDKSPDIKNYLKVKSVPTLCNFINGDMMDTLSGSNKDHIISFFQKTYDKTSS